MVTREVGSIAQGTILYQERYRIDLLLTRTPHRAIYRAWDLSRNRAATIVELVSADEAITTRALERAAPLVQMDHPTLHAFQVVFVEHDTVFLALTFASGQTLEHIMRDRAAPIPAAAAVRWISQVAEMLEFFATSLPDWHLGDLSSSALFVTAEDRAQPLSFELPLGLLTPQRIAADLPQGVVAPELAQGQCDARADVYSLAATLHLLLTRQAWPGGDPAAQSALDDVAPALPRPMIDAVRRGLAQDPANRWSDVGAFHGALLTALTAPTEQTDWWAASVPPQPMHEDAATLTTSRDALRNAVDAEAAARGSVPPWLASLAPTVAGVAATTPPMMDEIAAEAAPSTTEQSDANVPGEATPQLEAPVADAPAVMQNAIPSVTDPHITEDATAPMATPPAEPADEHTHGPDSIAPLAGAALGGGAIIAAIESPRFRQPSQPLDTPQAPPAVEESQASASEPAQPSPETNAARWNSASWDGTPYPWEANVPDSTTATPAESALASLDAAPTTPATDAPAVPLATDQVAAPFAEDASATVAEYDMPPSEVNVPAETLASAAIPRRDDLGASPDAEHIPAGMWGAVSPGILDNIIATPPYATEAHGLGDVQPLAAMPAATSAPADTLYHVAAEQSTSEPEAPTPAADAQPEVPPMSATSDAATPAPAAEHAEQNVLVPGAIIGGAAIVGAATLAALTHHDAEHTDQAAQDAPAPEATASQVPDNNQAPAVQSNDDWLLAGPHAAEPVDSQAEAAPANTAPEAAQPPPAEQPAAAAEPSSTPEQAAPSEADRALEQDATNGHIVPDTLGGMASDAAIIAALSGVHTPPADPDNAPQVEQVIRAHPDRPATPADPAPVGPPPLRPTHSPNTRPLPGDNSGRTSDTGPLQTTKTPSIPLIERLRQRLQANSVPATATGTIVVPRQMYPKNTYSVLVRLQYRSARKPSDSVPGTQQLAIVEVDAPADAFYLPVRRLALPIPVSGGLSEGSLAVTALRATPVGTDRLTFTFRLNDGTVLHKGHFVAEVSILGPQQMASGNPMVTLVHTLDLPA